MSVEDEDHGHTRERRTAPRIQVQLSVLARSGTEQTSAQLVNISASGALLEAPWAHPPLGALVKLQFESPEVDGPIKLTGTVARHTASGFAVKFHQVTKELLHLVGDR